MRGVTGKAILSRVTILLVFAGCSGPAGESGPPEPLNLLTDLTGDVTEISTRGAGPDEPLIGEIRGARFTAEGDVAVLDVQDPHLKLFDAAGALVGTMGRSGQGPDELSGVLSLAAGRDGTLYVLDARGSVTRLAADGREMHRGRAPVLFAAGMDVVCGRPTFYGVVSGEGGERREGIVSLGPHLQDPRTEWTGAEVTDVRLGDRLMAGSDVGARVRAALSEQPGTWSRICDEEGWRRVSGGGATDGPDPAGGDGGALPVRPGARGPAGVGPFEGGSLELTGVVGSPVVTEAAWITSEGTKILRILGLVVLEDVGPEGRLLFSTTVGRGEPILLSIPSRSLLAAFDERGQP